MLFSVIFDDSAMCFKFKLVFLFCSLVTLVVFLGLLFQIRLQYHLSTLEGHHLLFACQVLLCCAHWQSLLGQVEVAECLVVVLLVCREVHRAELALCTGVLCSSIVAHRAD